MQSKSSHSPINLQFFIDITNYEIQQNFSPNMQLRIHMPHTFKYIRKQNHNIYLGIDMSYISLYIPLRNHNMHLFIRRYVKCHKIYPFDHNMHMFEIFHYRKVQPNMRLFIACHTLARQS